MSARSIRCLQQLGSSLRSSKTPHTPARAICIPLAARPLFTSTPLYKKSKAAAAKKGRNDKDDSSSNEGPIADLNDVLGKTERKMEKAVDWARGVIYEMVERGRGRVTPGT